MLDGAQGKKQVWRPHPMFKSKFFREHLHCINENTCGILSFGALVIVRSSLRPCS